MKCTSKFTFRTILFGLLSLFIVATTQAQLKPPQENVVSRFLRYVQINTQSEEGSSTIPSTPGQLEFAKMLAKDLEDIGAENIRISEFGFVYATIPSNLPSNAHAPTIGLLAHMDTAPEISGANVKPIIHKKYKGDDIILPGDSTQIITVKENPVLKDMIGDDIITADGTTLLGSDDKAGCASIMAMVDILLQNPQLKHGKIAIGFTPDEEVGEAIQKFDIEGFGAKYAFTVDGGTLGKITNENWYARRVDLAFKGHDMHAGYAKGKMVNSLNALASFILRIPIDLRAESTEGRQGYLHPLSGSITVGLSKLQTILRDYEKTGLDRKESLLRNLAQKVEKDYPGLTISFEIKEQYQNMYEVLKNYPELITSASEAVRRAGLKPELTSARGGTDGSFLSFHGLPCPDIFNGGNNFHSKHEFNSSRGLEKSTETLLNLVQIFAEKQ